MRADIHASAAERLGVAGSRYTPNRRHLVEVLAEVGRPIGVEEILSERSDLAQSSVYRNLVVLEGADVVHRVVTGDGLGRFELSEGLTEHHHHAVCSVCGSIRDITVPPRLERDLLRIVRELGRRVAFATSSHRIDLMGTCSDCARASGGGTGQQAAR